MISVIVPVYNIEKYVAECLESIVNQTYRDLEIIVVDDGSNDSSPEICDAYAARDKRIRVIHKKNQGLVSARKTGLGEAHGEYVGYVDGDDWIEADMYERMVSKMLYYDADVVMCGIYEDTGEVRKRRGQSFEEGFYDKNRIRTIIYPRMITGDKFFEWNLSPSVWDKLFKRKILLPFQMAVDERIRMGEDAACTYPYMLHAGSCYIMKEYCYHYRQTTGSMVKQLQDYEREREQFRILYNSVLRRFERDREQYDLCEQWNRYVTFLMIPRSDGLYRGFERLDFLFPFSLAVKGARIILYGAGTYGQRLYHYLIKTEFCHVSAWVDRNYKELSKEGLPVQNPDRLEEAQYDVIVIANTYWKSRMGIYESLLERGIDRSKICMINEELLFTEAAKKAYGMA